MLRGRCRIAHSPHGNQQTLSTPHTCTRVAHTPTCHKSTPTDRATTKRGMFTDHRNVHADSELLCVQMETHTTRSPIVCRGPVRPASACLRAHDSRSVQTDACPFWRARESAVEPLLAVASLRAPACATKRACCHGTGSTGRLRGLVEALT